MMAENRRKFLLATVPRYHLNQYLANFFRATKKKLDSDNPTTKNLFPVYL